MHRRVKHSKDEGNSKKYKKLGPVKESDLVQGHHDDDDDDDDE
jgi:hypothetical protein